MDYAFAYFPSPITAAAAAAVAAAAITLGALARWWLERRGLERLRAPKPGTVVWLAAAVYLVVFSAVTVGQYYAMAKSFDLAYWANVVYQSSRGWFYHQSVDPNLGAMMRQLSFSVVALAPGAWFSPNPVYLLIVQTLAQAAAIIIIFRTAAPDDGPRWPAAALALSFALSPALHGANLYDFDSRALGVPVILGACYFFSRRRVWPGLALTAVAALTREDLALYAVALAAWGGVASGRRKAGLAAAGAILVYFVVAACVVYPKLTYAPDTPILGSWTFTRHFQSHKAAGAGVAGADHLGVLPAKAGYLLTMLIPVAALLPFAGGAWAIVATPAALSAATSMAPAYKFGLHYPFAVLPFLYGAAAVGVRRLAARPAEKKKGVFLTAAGVGAVLTQGFFIAAVARSYYAPVVAAACPGPYEKALARAVKAVPADVAVCADEPFLSHLAHRRYVYFYNIARTVRLRARPTAMLLERRYHPLSELPGILDDARAWRLGLVQPSADFAYFAATPTPRPNEELFRAWFQRIEDDRCSGPNVKADVADARAGDGRAAYVPYALRLSPGPGYVYPAGDYDFAFLARPAGPERPCYLVIRARAVNPANRMTHVRRRVTKALGGGKYEFVHAKFKSDRPFLFGFDVDATAPFYFDAVVINSPAFTLPAVLAAAQTPGKPRP